jgi:prepilin-type N-terminal cleavage/methylation domain-containing protein
MSKLKGFTLIELLIVVAIIAILAAIAVPNFLEAQIRSKVSRIKADQRSVATALESYYVDNNTYPAWAAEGASFPCNMTTSVHSPLADSAKKLRTFAVRPGAAGAADGLMFTMTTPIAYITGYPRDPFMTTRSATFGYYSDPLFVGWILYSVGPDTDEGLGSDLNVPVETVYIPHITQPSVTLITRAGGNDCYTYDPTNGTTSGGDVWRVKQ